MQEETFVKRSRIPAPVDKVFRWHAMPGALERLTPPWEPTRVIRREGGIRTGARTVMKVRLGPLWLPWVASHTAYEEGRLFQDVQVTGPFARWKHTHLFEPDGPDGCFLEDRIEYAIRFGPLGRRLGGPVARRRLQRMFDYRHRILAADMANRDQDSPASSMTVLVSGAGGVVGQALGPFLASQGHRVVRLVRRPPVSGADEVFWDPQKGTLDRASLEGMDAVVHLAGESIAQGRWTDAKKRQIINSRVQGTSLLSEAISGLNRAPRAFVSASAIGYYGDRGAQPVLEDGEPGRQFVSEVCTRWEEAASPSVRAGVRTVFLRIGVVLSPAGGSLKKLLPSFQLGLGARISSGEQYMSWIAMDDLLGIVDHLLADNRLQGPVNAVAPNPVTNRTFTRELAATLGRPALFTLPSFLLELAFGEMGREILLSGARVQPGKLLEAGYRFRFPELGGALRHLTGRLEP